MGGIRLLEVEEEEREEEAEDEEPHDVGTSRPHLCVWESCPDLSQ